MKQWSQVVSSEVASPVASEDAALSWEAEVLRRIAPRLAEVQRRAAQDGDVLGWEAAGVSRLNQEIGQEH